MGLSMSCRTPYEHLTYQESEGIDEQRVRDLLEKLNCCMWQTNLSIQCDACRMYLISEDRYGSGRVLFMYWDDDKFTGRGGVLIDPSIPDDDEWAEWQIELDDGGGLIYPSLRETVSRDAAMETALRIIRLGHLPSDVVMMTRPIW